MRFDHHKIAKIIGRFTWKFSFRSLSFRSSEQNCLNFSCYHRVIVLSGSCFSSCSLLLLLDCFLRVETLELPSLDHGNTTRKSLSIVRDLNVSGARTTLDAKFSGASCCVDVASTTCTWFVR